MMYDDLSEDSEEERKRRYREKILQVQEELEDGMKQPEATVTASAENTVESTGQGGLSENLSENLSLSSQPQQVNQEVAAVPAEAAKEEAVPAEAAKEEAAPVEAEEEEEQLQYKTTTLSTKQLKDQIRYIL